jgi:hypothetical protein
VNWPGFLFVTVKTIFSRRADFAGVCVTSATLLGIIDCEAVTAGTTDIIIGYHVGCFRLKEREGSTGARTMIIPQTPNSAEERKRVARLEVARRLYQALIVQDPDRLITLRDSAGRVMAQHDPRPEQSGTDPAASL